MLFRSILCGLFPLGADATQQKIDQVQEGIEDLEKQEKEAQQKADNLSQEAVGLEGDLAEFNNRLAEVVTELNETEQQLAITRQNLKDTRKALKEAGQKHHRKALQQFILIGYQKSSSQPFPPKSHAIFLSGKYFYIPFILFICQFNTQLLCCGIHITFPSRLLQNRRQRFPSAGSIALPF